MRRSRGAALLAALVVAAGAPDVGAAPPDDGVPALAGTVEVTGAGGSFLRVELPQPATLDLGPTEELRTEVVLQVFRRTGLRAVEVTGSGPVQGFALVSADRPLPPPGAVCGGLPRPECPPVAVASVVEDAEGFDATAGINLGFEQLDDGPFGVVRVPAGHYRLYLLGDAGPQRVRFRLEGLSGEVRLRTDERSPVHRNERLPARLDVLGQRTVQSFGTTLDNGPYALTVFGLVAGTAPQEQTYAGAETGYCFYLGGHAVPDATAYLPGCPSRATTPGGAVELQVPRRFERGLTQVATGARGAGPESVGGWYAAYGVATRGSGPLAHLDISGRTAP